VTATRAYIVTPGFEAALAAELDTAAAGAPRARVVTPGVVVRDERAGDADDAPTEPDPAFARQVLPRATLVQGASVRELAEGAFAAVDAAVDAAAGPFTVHAFPARDADGEDPPGLGSRATLVGAALLDILKERRRRAFRRHRPPSPDTAAAFDAGWLLVQLVALDRGRMLVSAAAPRPLPLGGYDLSPWPAGDAPVAIDRAPPSRAYQKLEEAFQWLGESPAAGDRCVDLGGSPGGWAYAALRRGARVTAVDRAPLEPPAAGHPGLTALIGNAFTYEPPPGAPADWLLCDVICEPARSIALIDRWLDRRWCRRLVVTVKFKGQGGYGALATIPPLLTRAGWRFGRVKQLRHNKNEVTVMGREQW
jgi:23S rRNA (cytidine2498-2'-O)-methyltransferase